MQPCFLVTPPAFSIPHLTVISLHLVHMQPPFIEFVLKEMGSGFHNFVKGNSDGITEGAKAFEADVYGEGVSYLARPYVEKSRKMLQDFTGTILDPQQAAAYTALLAKFGLDDLYAPDTAKYTSKL